jgi:hypothetical protein
LGLRGGSGPEAGGENGIEHRANRRQARDSQQAAEQRKPSSKRELNEALLFQYTRQELNL